MSQQHVVIQPRQLSLDTIRQIWRGGLSLKLSDAALIDMEASSAIIQKIIQKGDAAYGINTGYGKLAQTRIPDDELELLQKNLILSHSVGVGEPLSHPVVRLIVAWKVASLARGFSGIRPVVVERLLAMYNADIMPVIPAKGSVGASGDLAPLSHMTLALMGQGDAFYQGERMPAKAA